MKHHDQWLMACSIKRNLVSLQRQSQKNETQVCVPRRTSQVSQAADSAQRFFQVLKETHPPMAFAKDGHHLRDSRPSHSCAQQAVVSEFAGAAGGMMGAGRLLQLVSDHELQLNSLREGFEELKQEKIDRTALWAAAATFCRCFSGRPMWSC